MNHEARFSFLTALCVATALSLVTGCRTPPPQTYSVNEILAMAPVGFTLSADPNSPNALDPQAAGRFVDVLKPLAVTPMEGGGMRAQIRLRNKTQEDFTLAYNFAWLDEAGLEICRSPLRKDLFKALATLSPTDICTDPAGVSAEIEIRLLPVDQAVGTGLYTFDDAADSLVKKFVNDPVFAKTCQQVTERLGGGRKPVIVVRAFDNNVVGERNTLRLSSLAKDFRSAVRKAGKFDLKDDDATQAMVDRIKYSANGGLENGELLNTLKTHVSPDFILTGELVDDSSEAYRLDLVLHDLSGVSGRGGTIAWEGKSKINKSK